MNKETKAYLNRLDKISNGLCDVMWWLKGYLSAKTEEDLCALGNGHVRLLEDAIIDIKDNVESIKEHDSGTKK